ncbi:ABC transporter substrate-binding protein [Roseomonas sp. AR75]|uniref:ABC transporter substrate-binding protein n=1 Tax=Roseomonas sp. AR75 TaxID=2562311 RepID=UPI0010BF6FA7|nr:ABC transporter substrate-binding protein [Roseomonas sp. AR75]
MADAARAGLLLLGLLLGTGAAAEPLRIGVAVETRTLDPHQSATAPNVQALRHIYETLVTHDAQHRLVPGLAASWTMDPADATRWVVRLRADVRFHDGQPFGAADVAASLARAMDPPGGVGGYASYYRQLRSVTVLDAATLDLRTAAPHAGLPFDLTAAMIIPRGAAGLGTEAFNAGAVTGTGPYRLVGWTRGTALSLARNEGWWGPAQPWSRVEILPRPNEGSRVAGLLAGELDLIEQVPTSALGVLARRDDIGLLLATTTRIIFLNLDLTRDASPFVTDAAGRPLQPNPLRDARVRRAISLAIDRAALAEQVMGGAAEPAGQVVPPGWPGASAALPPDRFDPAEARRLLREAGMPAEARLVLHGPNDRYLNDEKVLVAVATMLRRIGLSVEPAALPNSVLRARMIRGEASFALNGWSTETGDAALALRALLGARGRPSGWGQLNFLGYANEAFEAALDAAMTETDAARRAAALARATDIALPDRALVPLYFQRAAWATRRGFGYRGRADEYTLAISAYPAR